MIILDSSWFWCRSLSLNTHVLDCLNCVYLLILDVKNPECNAPQCVLSPRQCGISCLSPSSGFMVLLQFRGRKLTDHKPM